MQLFGNFYNFFVRFLQKRNNFYFFTSYIRFIWYMDAIAYLTLKEWGRVYLNITAREGHWRGWSTKLFSVDKKILMRLDRMNMIIEISVKNYTKNMCLISRYNLTPGKWQPVLFIHNLYSSFDAFRCFRDSISRKLLWRLKNVYMERI